MQIPSHKQQNDCTISTLLCYYVPNSLFNSLLVLVLQIAIYLMPITFVHISVSLVIWLFKAYSLVDSFGKDHRNIISLAFSWWEQTFPFVLDGLFAEHKILSSQSLALNISSTVLHIHVVQSLVVKRLIIINFLFLRSFITLLVVLCLCSQILLYSFHT